MRSSLYCIWDEGRKKELMLGMNPRLHSTQVTASYKKGSLSISKNLFKTVQLCLTAANYSVYRCGTNWSLLIPKSKLYLTVAVWRTVSVCYFRESQITEFVSIWSPPISSAEDWGSIWPEYIFKHKNFHLLNFICLHYQTVAQSLTSDNPWAAYVVDRLISVASDH